ncbi:MAG: hypothetical protein ACE5FY_03970 [Nitrospiria bacterium]
MKKFYLAWLLSAGLFFYSNGAARAEVVIMHGIPIIQNRSSKDVTENIKLHSTLQMSNRVLIVKDEGKYYWQTRDRRELVYQKLKKHDLFIDMKTGGYIKVVPQPDGSYVYMEHISIKRLKSFVYWGHVEVYNP